MNVMTVKTRQTMFERLFKVRTVALGFIWGLLIAPVIFGLYVHAAATSNANAEPTYDLQPVINSDQVPPLVMLVMSRDEQLYNKAYTDYTDLDGDGVIDATYDDAFTYAGYFGSTLCYSYTAGVFMADNPGTGAHNHFCSGEWSGNFLNWLSMSRLDIVRSVLYGGLRSTDTSSQTILERAAVPNDLHAWVKVYSAPDISNYTPFDSSAQPVSFCNASIYNSSGVPATGPLMRVAQGNWSEWSATQDSQCNWHDTDGDSNNAPQASGLGAKDYVVRVDVCDETAASLIDPTGNVTREPFCRKYTDNSGAAPVDHWKPAGLLQQYGETGKMRFGLMTGSYADPRSGGRLRRNIGKFAGNGPDPTTCVAGDEVKLSDGTFCNQTAGTEGIVNTLNRFELVGWQSHTNGSGSGWMGDAAGDNCYAWGGRARNGNGGTWVMDNPGGGDRHCSAYGNPLSEIYAEAVRYIEGQGNQADPTFDANNDGSYINGIPDHVAWQDPYRDPANGGNPYCASCSILVLSTGLNSFDTDEIPNDASGIVSPPNVLSAVDELGDDEGITGKNYLIGRVLGKLTDNGTISPTSLTLGASIDTNADLCTSKTIDKLSNAIGVCPDVPSLEGSYYIAGLAFKAWTTDLRPDLTTTQNKPSNYVNDVQTYTVALAESLPSFAINAGGSTISFSPMCQSNTNGSAQITDANWSSCALGAVEVGTKTSIVSPNYVYGRPVLSDNSAGSFAFVWEDSTFGSDHDLDATDMITWCVGPVACSYTTQVGIRKDLSGNPYNGYDICWRSDSPICTASGGKPAVAAGQVLIRIETMSTAGGYAMLTGFNVAGSTADGVQRVELAPGSFNSILTGQTDPPGAWYKPKVLSFTAGGSGAGRLENPLFYAAKYGGFHPAFDPTTGKPNTPQTPGVVWDGQNNETGAPGADGLPDNFFPVHNPALLGQQLGNALNAIIKKTGSGTAAAVVSNSVNGDGVVYRALYQPQSQDTSASPRTVYWTGTLNALWTDSYGYLREDGNANAKLDGYDVDPIIVFYTDPTDSTAKFSECETSDPTFVPSKFTAIDPATGMFSQTQLDATCPGNSGGKGEALDQAKTIWDAQQQLWASSGAFVTNIAKQRNYTDTSDTGRYIFTWIDKNHNGVVDAGEQTDFVWNAGGSGPGFYGQKNADGTVQGDFGFLNSNDPAEAQNIVNWIRGEDDIAGLRSRTIDPVSSNLDANWTGGDVTARLGDIIDSTPLVVGRPAEAYDLLYGDTTYATFRAHYRDRRQVAYVGANDGMLHAFNGGFYNASLHELDTAPISGSGAADPLGGELWAYVPGDLLPHLRWLTSTDYKAQHVFYVDGNPVATDAKVFADNGGPNGDCAGVPAGTICHPGGWGTILVVPFRLGGGMIQVPTALNDGDAYDPATCDKSNCVQQTSYSAYAVLDVTDPEQPPQLLAELHPASDDGNGQSFTSSVPAFAVMRNPTSGNPDKFFMFIGSGPTAPADDGLKGTPVTSTAPLRVYAYDLGCVTGEVKAGCGASNTSPIRSFDFSNGGAVGGAKNSFAGDLIASDFNLNDQAEAVYFGSVRDPQTGASPIEFQGSLWKLALNENTDPTTWKPELVYDTARPITARPTLALNNRDAPLVYVGTGRLLAKDDLTTVGQQQIVGMIDPELLPAGDVQSGFTLPLKTGDLENVTNVQVCGDITNKLCTYGTVTGDPSGATTFADLQTLFNEAPPAGKAGFYLNLAATGTSPAERVVSAQALLGGILITNAFTPGVGVCNNVGTAEEFALNYQSGTGDPAFSSDVTGGFGLDKNGNVKTTVSLGQGLPASPSLHVGTGTGNRELTACTQTSTGAIICQKISTLNGVLSGEVSWREPLDQ